MLTSASKLNFMYIFVIYERCVVSLHATTMMVTCQVAL